MGEQHRSFNVVPPKSVVLLRDLRVFYVPYV
jgi:hypothetical protein